MYLLFCCQFVIFNLLPLPPQILQQVWHLGSWGMEKKTNRFDLFPVLYELLGFCLIAIDTSIEDEMFCV